MMNISIKWLGTTLLAGLSYAAFSQGSDVPPNHYLNSTEINKQYKDCFKKQSSAECKEAATRLAYIGLTDSAIATLDISSKQTYKPDTKLDAVTHNTAPLNAVLSKNIASRKVIIIEVLPYYSPAVVFTASTLENFSKAGYKYLATDGVYNADALNNKKGPDTETGPAAFNPQYNSLLRLAVSLGFTIVNYDCADCKDSDKKAGSIAGILAKDPEAKVLVLSHDKTAEIATRLQNTAQVTAFLINQSAYFKHSKATYELPLYQKLSSQLKEPSVVYESGTNSYSGDPSFNFTVFFPETKYTNGRADYLQNSTLLKQSVSFPAKMKFPILVKVIQKNEYETNGEKALPVDAIEIQTAQETVDVFAPLKGEYIVSFSGVDRNERVMPVEFK